MLDEVEQRVVGPLQVLEHEDERVTVRDRLQEPSPGRERLRAPVSLQFARGLEADETAQVALDPSGLGTLE